MTWTDTFGILGFIFSNLIYWIINLHHFWTINFASFLYIFIPKYDICNAVSSFFWHLTFLQVVSSAIIYYQIVVNLENTPPRNTYSHINLNATFPLCNPLVSFITQVLGKLFYCSIMIDIKSLHITISWTCTNVVNIDI